MKKLLQTSAAVFAFAAGFSCPALANTNNVSAGGLTGFRPSLTVSGQGTFAGQFFNGKRTAENGGKGRGNHFGVNDSSIIFDASGKADAFSGAEYSWIVSFDGDGSKTDAVALDNYLKIKTDWGTVIGGNINGIEDRGRGPYTFFGGTGGIEGVYLKTSNLSTGVLPTTDIAGRTKRATKLIYLTPRIAGFMIGVSFTPGSRHIGNNKLRSISDGKSNAFFTEGQSFGQNVWAGSIDFSRCLPYGFAINLSLVGLRGHAKSGVDGALIHRNNRVHDIRSWALGGDISYTYGDHIFKLGAEYVDNNKTQLIKFYRPTAGGDFHSFRGGNAGKIYSIGASYELGSHKFVYGYLRSDRKLGNYALNNGAFTNLGDAKADVHSVTYDKKMAPGWSVFGEYTHYRYRTSDAAAALQTTIKTAVPLNFDDGVRSNNGNAFIVGTKVKF